MRERVSRWFPATQTQKGDIVFLCFACECECVAVAKTAKEAGQCPFIAHSPSEVCNKFIQTYGRNQP